MINSILTKIVLMSFSGSVIALIIFAIKPFAKFILPKIWFYYIWLAVILRLAVPFSPKTNLLRSFHNFIENSSQISSAFSASLIEGKIGSYIGMVWLCIAVILMIKKIISYQVYTRFIKSNRKEIDNKDIMRLFNEVCAEMHVKNKISLYSYKKIDCPMLIGFIKPYVVLPETMLNNTHDLRYILMHEITHHKRRDFLYKWLMQIILCVHFFNPVAYLLRNTVNKYCELSCDEALIRKLDKHGKKAYGSALINALEINSDIRPHTAVSLMLCEDAKQIKERLDAIMIYQHGTNRITVYTFILTCLICLCSVYIGVYAGGICICV